MYCGQGWWGSIDSTRRSNRLQKGRGWGLDTDTHQFRSLFVVFSLRARVNEMHLSGFVNAVLVVVVRCEMFTVTSAVV
jgi:hypothetical protein